MKSNDEILLSICIPTYNRYVYLKRCLETICIQYTNRMPIELLISDNNSNDNTNFLVHSYIEKNIFPITYILNEENKGADFNISQCYIEAKGAFVYVIGDDDVLLPGSLEYILNVIQLNPNSGLIHLKSYSFKEDYMREVPMSYKNNNFSYDRYLNMHEFIESVNFWVTFISGNIVNKKYIDNDKLLLLKGTSLSQLGAIMNAIISSSNNIIINKYVVGAQADNTGGYNLYEVFSKNFLLALDKLLIDKSIIDIIKKHLLMNFFPIWFMALRTSNSSKFEGTNRDAYFLLNSIFHNHLYWHLFCRPLFFLTKPFDKIYYYLTRVIVRIILFVSVVKKKKFFVKHETHCY